MIRSCGLKSSLSMTLLLSLLSTPLFAQIYETTDAGGNPSFSDTPSAGAQEVETGQTNVVDAVEVPPAPAAKQDHSQTINTSPAEHQQQEQIDPIEPYIVNNNDDDEYDGRRDQRPLGRPESKRVEEPSVKPAIREANLDNRR